MIYYGKIIFEHILVNIVFISNQKNVSSMPNHALNLSLTLQKKWKLGNSSFLKNGYITVIYYGKTIFEHILVNIVFFSNLKKVKSMPNHALNLSLILQKKWKLGNSSFLRNIVKMDSSL